MARIRSIKPEFWTSEQILECSTNARLLFIGLWNFCDDQGRHPYSAKQAKAEVFPADDFTEKDILGMLNELSTKGLIVRYESENKEYFYVTGWRHQRIDKPQAPKYPDPEASNSTIIPGTLPPDRIGGDTKGEERNIGRSPKVTRPTDDEFEKIRKVYPKRKGSPNWQEARKKISQALKSVSFEDLMRAVQRFSDEEASLNHIGTEFVPQASTWFHQQRFMDYLGKPEPPAGPIEPSERDVEFFRKTGRWHHAYGPEPGQLGCRVPHEILMKHGYIEAA